MVGQPTEVKWQTRPTSEGCSSRWKRTTGWSPGSGAHTLSQPQQIKLWGQSRHTVGTSWTTGPSRKSRRWHSSPRLAKLLALCAASRSFAPLRNVWSKGSRYFETMSPVENTKNKKPSQAHRWVEDGLHINGKEELCLVRGDRDTWVVALIETQEEWGDQY